MNFHLCSSKFQKTNRCFMLFEQRNNLLTYLDVIIKKLNIPAMIIGGAALPRYNYNRATEDIDLITTTKNAYKLGDELEKTGQFEFVGRNSFLHKSSGMRVNFCPEGMPVGSHKNALRFPSLEVKQPGMHYVSLPTLLAMKIQAKRLKDRGDYGELIKRNKLSKGYIEQEVLPLLGLADRQWALSLWDEAQKEI